LQIFIATE